MLVSGDVEEDVIQHNNEELTEVVAKESQIARSIKSKLLEQHIRNYNGSGNCTHDMSRLELNDTPLKNPIHDFRL